MEITLNKDQDKVIASTKRFIACISGKRGGKSTVGAVWLLKEIYDLHQKGVDGDFLLAAPTFKILEQSTLPKFREYFPKDWGVWKENKSYFELAWNRPGSEEPCRVFVRSLDEPDSIEGMDALAAWIDECGKVRQLGWINVQGRLSMKKGRCILTSTPYSMNWFYTDVYKKWKEGDPDYDCFMWSSIDNPHFPKDEFERMKRTLPKAQFQMMYEGKFSRMSGLVYPDFDEDTNIVEPFKVPDNWFKFGGMDFGWSNANAILSICEDPSSHTYYVYKEFYRSETLLKIIAEYIRQERLSYILADTQSSQLINELNRFYGLGNIKEADKTLEAGIERLRTLFADGRLKVFRTCVNTIDELKEYHYQQSNSDLTEIEKPVAKHNHACDALRYAFSKPLQGLYAHRPKKVQVQHQSRRLAAYDPITGF